MPNLHRSWLENRKELRRLRQADAKTLIERDERGAYYNAQRVVAKSRKQRDGRGMVQWTKVAAEVARKSAFAEMDCEVVQAILDEELEAK